MCRDRLISTFKEKNSLWCTLNNADVWWCVCQCCGHYTVDTHKDGVFPLTYYSKVPIIQYRKLLQRNQMNLPGSSRGLWIDLDNPKIKEIKNNYLHEYPIFCLSGIHLPFLSGKRTPLSKRRPVPHSMSGMVLSIPVPCTETW